MSAGRPPPGRGWLWLLFPVLFLLPVVLITLREGGRLALSGAAAGPPPGGLHFGLRSVDSIIVDRDTELVLLDFWASWCGGCMRELPVLDSLYAISDRGRVLFLAVDSGDPDSSLLTEGSVPGLPEAMPVVWLSESDAEAAAARWDLPAILPYAIVLDRNGNVLHRMAGARSAGEVVGTLEALTEGPTLFPGTDGAAPSDSGAPDDLVELHVYVVGPAADSLTVSLLEVAAELAGEDGAELLDPGTEDGAAALDSLMLPSGGYPYAQACFGDACGRPVGSTEELRAIAAALTGQS